MWPEFRITPIFTTHFCEILPEPWETLRMYTPSGYIHGTDPCVTGHVINLLLFSSQLTFLAIFSKIFYDDLFFFAYPLIFLPPSINFSPPKNFFTPLLIFSLALKISLPSSFYPLGFFCPPRNFSSLCYNILLSLQKLTQYIVNMTTSKFLWPELNSNHFRTGQYMLKVEKTRILPKRGITHMYYV